MLSTARIDRTMTGQTMLKNALEPAKRRRCRPTLSSLVAVAHIWATRAANRNTGMPTKSMKIHPEANTIHLNAALADGTRGDL